MLELEENLKLLRELKIKLKEVKESMKITFLKENLAELEKISLQDNFWEDAENSSQIFTKIKALQKKINTYENTSKELENLVELNELLQSEYDGELLKDLFVDSKKIKETLEKLEIQTLFSGKYDFNNAIITLHPRSWWN